MTIKELVAKDNRVVFSHFKKGFFYYNLTIDNSGTEEGYFFNKTILQFTVPLEDVGDATLYVRDKAILFMRWIRKAQESNTLIELTNDTEAN